MIYRHNGKEYSFQPNDRIHFNEPLKTIDLDESAREIIIPAGIYGKVLDVAASFIRIEADDKPGLVRVIDVFDMHILTRIGQVDAPITEASRKLLPPIEGFLFWNTIEAIEDVMTRLPVDELNELRKNISINDFITHWHDQKVNNGHFDGLPENVLLLQALLIYLSENFGMMKF